MVSPAVPSIFAVPVIAWFFRKGLIGIISDYRRPPSIVELSPTSLGFVIPCPPVSFWIGQCLVVLYFVLLRIWLRKNRSVLKLHWD